MKSIRKTLITALCFLCLCASALADGAPASQFGFKGWPYRQPITCTQAVPAPQRTSRPAATPRVTPAPTADHLPAVSANVGDYTTLSVSAQEDSAWKMINADREANGRQALPLDAELCAIARIKACDMKSNHYFAHTSPTFGRAADMLTFFGYSFKGVGENIAHYATLEKAQAGFMSSSSHRANMLGSQWTRVGVGVCVDDNGFVYVTQLFAR